ncbi:MAG: phosphoglycolate phosphatase [Castellaniella sp.]
MSITPPIRAALFDLDGTLLDTLADIAASANAMLAELGLASLPAAHIRDIIGKGSAHMVGRLLEHQRPGDPANAAQADAALAHYLAHYRRINGRHASPYPGVHEGLKAFADQGMRLGVVTNKLTEFTRPLLEKTGLAHHFQVIVCGDTCARRKPDPMPVLHACNSLDMAPAQTVLIGDSVNDTTAGRAAGTHVLAVPYGYNEGKQVHALDVDAIVSSIDAAAQWVDARNAG